VQRPPRGGDVGREGLGPLLREEQEDPVAAAFVVLDDRTHGAGDVPRIAAALGLDIGRRPLDRGVDESFAAAEVAQHRLDADPRLVRDVGERDVGGEPLLVQQEHRVEDPPPRLLHRPGARRHPGTSGWGRRGPGHLQPGTEDYSCHWTLTAIHIRVNTR
jgi:hypothetical protein